MENVFLFLKVMKISVGQKFSKLGPLRSQELGVVLIRLILDYPIYVRVTVLTCLCFLISPVEAARRPDLTYQVGFEPPFCAYI